VVLFSARGLCENSIFGLEGMMGIVGALTGYSGSLVAALVGWGVEWEAKANQAHEFPRANDRRRGWALAHRLGCNGALG
jgi:hypothetical protein